MNKLVTPYNLYCDLDDVLCDFTGQWIKFTGLDCDQFRAKYGKQRFTEILQGAPESFWSDMDWIKGGKQLWETVSKYPVTILSTPANSKQCITGKKKWIAKHTPSVEYLFKPAAEKQQYAGPDSILIDDFDRNISQWQSKSGIGILHKTTRQSLIRLKQYGIT